MYIFIIYLFNVPQKKLGGGLESKLCMFFLSSFSGGGRFGDVFVEEKSMVPIPPKGLGEGPYCDVT